MHYTSIKIKLPSSIFEPELALLVGLQVMSCKGGELEVEGELFDKILYALNRSSCRPLVGQGLLGVTKNA